MSTVEWAGLIVSIIAIVSGFSAAIQWLVKHYLKELKPNGGESIKDDVKTTKRDMAQLKTDLTKLEESVNKLDGKFDDFIKLILQKNI